MYNETLMQHNTQQGSQTFLTIKHFKNLNQTNMSDFTIYYCSEFSLKHQLRPYWL